MKPRPPTLREKRRYILARIVPHYRRIEARQMYIAAFEALTSLWGDARASELQMAVISCEPGHCIVRCRRNAEVFVETALSTITEAEGERVALHPLATSGTIHALRKHIRPIPEGHPVDGIAIGGREYAGILFQRQKVDLYAKGIKNQETLYFTCDEMEVD
ncbi:MAG TPA: ribonuclease P [Methanoculleus sp.]|nr:ribonuclease P [Methanoculleus sp.]